MSKVSAAFDSVDTAGVAAMRLKSSLSTLSNVEMRDDRDFDDGSQNYPEYFNQTAADTRFADYYNYGMQFNSFGPYASPWHSKYGYFEPLQRSDTRLTATVDSSEIKKCQSVLRSMGGTKINITSD